MKSLASAAAALAAAFLLAGLAVMVGPSASAHGAPDGWKFTLPEGEAAAGERAFRKLQCFSCHTVSGKWFTSPTQNPGGIGPGLTAAHAQMPREYLAESIIDSHQVVPEDKRFRGADGKSSRMGDYADSLTVRDLVDLVAFLQSVR